MAHAMIQLGTDRLRPSVLVVGTPFRGQRKQHRGRARQNRRPHEAALGGVRVRCWRRWQNSCPRSRGTPRSRAQSAMYLHGASRLPPGGRGAGWPRGAGTGGRRRRASRGCRSGLATGGSAGRNRQARIPAGGGVRSGHRPGPPQCSGFRGWAQQTTRAVAAGRRISAAHRLALRTGPLAAAAKHAGSTGVTGRVRQAVSWW
mmetsp:Transcript_46338/g.142956  ORF Transcript_46338/g.142956 Transcript_46338/m.142956 type:complete len:202 (-) Transcript_46338:267-872(-)